MGVTLGNEQLDLVNADAAAAEPPRAAAAVVTWLRRGGLAGLFYALAAIPAVSMAIEVYRAPKLQFYDYWFVLERVANLDGSLNLRGIFTYRNEHPTFLPGFIYWVDSWLFGGDNRPLGALSVVMVAASVALMTMMIPPSVHRVTKAALAAAFAIILFTPQGLHNFVMGMSGTGWLLANLTAVGALYAARRDRAVIAILVGIVGSLSYGTGFALWPALAVVFWLQRARLWKIVAPLVVGVAIMAAWALTLDGLNPGPETGRTGLEVVVGAFAGTAGALWGGLAPILGLVTIFALLTFVLLAGGDRIGINAATAKQAPALGDVSAWIGLAVYALGGVALIAVARSGEGLDSLLTSRYASVPALALCALLGLCVVYLPRIRPSVAVPVVMTLALVTYGLSANRASNVRDNYPKQDAIAVAMRVGVVHAVLDDDFPAIAVESARNIGVYPFNDTFTLGCGGPEIGDTVPMADATALQGAPGQNGYAGTIDTVRNRPGRDGKLTGWYFSGWALIAERRADCVVVVDQSGKIVGGGSVGYRRRDVVSELIVDEAHSGFVAVAPAETVDPVVLVKSGDTYYKVLAPQE